MLFANSLKAQSSAININYPTPAKDITQSYGQDSLTVSLEFAYSTPCATGAEVHIQFPAGVEYVSGSLTLLSSTGSLTISELDISNLNRPTFIVSAPIPSGLLTFVVERRATCSSPTVGKDEVYVYSCVDVSEDSEEINSYNIIAPALSMMAPASISGATLGSVYTRTSTISYGGFGAADTVYYAIVYPDGVIESTSTSDAILANGVSVDPAYASGDTLFYKLSGLALGADQIFTNSEVINVVESIRILSCDQSDNASRYILSWGESFSDLCLSSTSTAGIITLSSATPSLSLSLQTANPLDYCYEGEMKIQTIRITNTGTGPATNITIQPTMYIPSVITGTNYLDTTGGWDIKNSSGVLLFTAHNIVRNTNSYSSGIPEGSAGSACVVMVSRNITSTVDLEDFVLAAGDYIDLEVKTRSRDMRCNTCGGNSSVIRFTGPALRASGTYTNQCNTVNYNIPAITFFRKIQAGIGQTVEHPLDVNVGEPFLFRTRVTFRTNALSTTGELYYGIDLNGTGMTTTATSVMIGSVSYPISNIDGHLIIGPLLYSETDKVMELNLPLVSDGSVCNNVSIDTYTNLRYSDCSPLMRRSCDVYTLNVHCPSPCTSGGATPLSFNLKRISLGLADTDNDGIPDGTALADPSLINDHRSVNGDTLLGEWKIMVYPNSNTSDPNYGNDFTHVYIDFDLVNGSTSSLPGLANTLTPLDDIYVEIYPSDGSAPIFSPVPLTMSGSRHVHYEIGPEIRGGDFLSNDSIVFRAKYRVNAMSGTNMGTSGISGTGNNETFRTYNQVYSTYSARSTHTTAMIPEETYTCDNFNDYNLIRIIVLANNINSTNAITGCTGTVTGNISTALSGASIAEDITFPYEVRQFSWPDEVWMYVPPGMTYRPESNSLLFYSKPSNVTIVVPDENVIQEGQIIKIVGLKNYYQEFGGTIFGLDGYSRIDFTIRLDPTCDATAGLYTAAGNGLHVGYGNYFKTEDYSFNGISSPSTYDGVKFQSAYGGGYTVALPILQLNGGGTAQNYSGTGSWTLDVQNLANNSDAANGWLFIEELNSLTDVVVKNGSTVISPNANGFYELGTILRSSTRSITVEAKSTICNLDSMSIHLGYTCGSYPSEFEALSCTQTKWLKLANPSSQVQLSVLRQPGGGTPKDLCVVDSIILSINSAQQANLVNPYITFLPPSGIEIPSSTVIIEYPLGSGMYETVPVTTVSGLYKIDLNDHSAILSSGILGTALADGTYTPAGGDRQAKIVIPIATTCDFVSGSSFSFRAYGERPCGGVATGNGTNTRTNRFYINGISTSGSAALNIDLEGASAVSCSSPITVASTVTLLGEPSQVGDTIRYFIPNGMVFAGNFTSTSSASLHLTTLVDGSEIVKIAVPDDVAVSTDLEFSFDILPYGESCGSAIIIAEYIRSVSGLSCGSTTCANSSMILSEAESDPFNIEKPDLNITSVDVTTPLVAGVSNVFSIEIENAHALLEAPANTYIVEFYCGDAATPFASEFFPQDIPPGSSVIGDISVTAPLTCAEGDLVTIKIQTITHGNISQCLCAPTQYVVSEPLPIELSELSFQSNGCDINLSWQTISDNNISHFIVERSIDNGKSFHHISDKIMTNGHAENYAFTYRNDYADYTFFRLQIVERNGKITYSKVHSHDGNGCKTTKISIKPNPTESVVNIDGLSKGQTIRIYNQLGQVVYNKTHLDEHAILQIDMHHLPAAIYFIQVSDNANTTIYSEQIIKK